MKVALYEPEIPQNVGAIMRTCACLNITLILIEPLGFTFMDRAFKRAKLDYNPDLIICSSIKEFFENFSNERKILFSPHTKQNHRDFSFFSNDILFFGRESNGVETEIASKMDAIVSISMSERCRSLNLAMAVTIALS
jgi:tRNA (cytidine/uridine-2'-O-)-methyltransferase